jgi:hypothetical protein
VNRPILSLWPELRRVLLSLLLLFGALTVLLFVAVSPFWLALPLFVVLAVGASLVAHHECRSRWWLPRLVRCVRRFRTTSNGRIVLHYAPELDGKWDMPTLLGRCQAELDQLTDQFGFPLRGRVVVFLFAGCRDVGTIFGPHVGGTALRGANAVVIADDSNIVKSLRHELAHLFAACWSLLAPPLLNEGLAVWLQDTEGGQTVDTAARRLLGERSLTLASLLKSEFFFAEPHRHACYVLAGSFTGFLIRRSGWQQYRKLFRLADESRFRATFKKCLGVTLEQAEGAWRRVLGRRTRAAW